jgi:hypothetical protein
MGNWDDTIFHISFFLNTGASRSILTEYVGPLEKAYFPIVGVNGVPNVPGIIPSLLHLWI